MSSSNSPNLSPAGVLSQAQWSELHKAIAPLSGQQLTWVSGYLAGLAQSHQPVAAISDQSAQQTNAKLTILYGSQTGNAKGVAEEYQQFVEQAGLSAELINMADYKPKKIKEESHLVIVVSTHGEGDAPDDAVELHEFLASKKAPKLAALKYAVVGLGDSSYEFFCQTAKDFDQRLAALGATALTERLDCDVDYDTEVSQWREKVTDIFKAELTSDASSRVVAMPGVSIAGATEQYTKKNPFTATLLEGQKITGRDSVKDIRHFEISLEGSGLTYQPGDALGVWFKNDGSMVDRLLDALALSGDTEVQVGDESLSLRAALIEKLELTQSYPSFAKAYAEFTQSSKLVQLLEDKAGLRHYLSERQIVDIVSEYPGKVEAQQFVSMLRPMTPRLYSIASSQAEVEDEVHLTVALVEYDAFGFTHRGGASGYLSHGIEEGAEVRVFVEKNDNFRLPPEPQTPVIMIGPGTGIAPFRAFMQQREAEDAEGKNWLFFGNPNFTQDFLYQVEWQRWVKSGVVDKVSLAFSRDQEEKIYVQHRLLEQGAEVYEWLEQGAHLYVCGDANRMAKDVHEALVSIVTEHGNKSVEQAEEYIGQLRKAKRYQRDVY
ncbi:assimilatory sulfite reductase (NADPH) flavoprotein subunit [Lacimicrobium sp. SS2-24]|uniref:assimilatory sulfite reductase (NADPH) flavoprotein subunit n=1 Tax=Lacimicrobium sp. SS2-24 TaxID=2005569 RepID=UPI000B4BF71A|nr:assimilatory sulfite reductase (NADPH) flavoprotein subunit [Lacimicrobium sp. SS2-24]